MSTNERTVLTAEQVAKIAKQADMATPGPWFDQYEYDGGRTVCQMRSTDTTFCVNKALHAPGPRPYESTKENGRFIAAARTNVPALCYSHEALRVDNQRLKAALQQVQWSSDAPDPDDSMVVYHLCPMCDQSETRGHSPDCLVGAALEGGK